MPDFNQKFGVTNVCASSISGYFISSVTIVKKLNSKLWSLYQNSILRWDIGVDNKLAKDTDQFWILLFQDITYLEEGV